MIFDDTDMDLHTYLQILVDLIPSLSSFVSPLNRFLCKYPLLIYVIYLAFLVLSFVARIISHFGFYHNDVVYVKIIVYRF